VAKDRLRGLTSEFGSPRAPGGRGKLCLLVSCPGCDPIGGVVGRGTPWERRQRGRSLSTKFDHQINHKKRRTSITYTHMLFILTYFHMFWKIIILQDIYTNTVEKGDKNMLSDKV
jgi:hypothetical protein